jgi:hypothetical protein
MNRVRRHKTRAITVFRIQAVLAASTCLVEMAFAPIRGIQRSVRVDLAESRLLVVSTALEGYRRAHSAYPPEGCDLAAALAPYVWDPRVLTNPLHAGDVPGRDLSDFYRPPRAEEAKRPGAYLACFPPADPGDPLVVLETGGRVRRCASPKTDSGRLQLGAVLAFLCPPQGAAVAQRPAPAASRDSDNHPARLLLGCLNLSPGSSDDFEFFLRKPDGSAITRSDLLASGPALEYHGAATLLRFVPKGNPRLNTLTLDGAPCPLRSGVVYTIAATQMTIHLHRDPSGRNGQGTGSWWITFDATNASLAH